MEIARILILSCLAMSVYLKIETAIAATITNNDSAPFLATITEKGRQAELVVEQGQTIEFCFEGCLITLPNGNRSALFGDETIEISNGQSILK